MAPLPKRFLRLVHGDGAPRSPVGAFRQDCWANDFRPVPVRTGEKRPLGVAWQELARRDPPPCADPGAAVRPAALSTGILCDGLRAIDVDIDDAQTAELIAGIARDLLGDAPVRWRSDSSRLLLLYAAAHGEPSKRSISGVHGKIEVLGRGQQFVADGIHPNGQPYQWHLGSPAEMRRESLVAVSEDDITEFLAEAALVIKSPAEKAEHRPDEDDASLGAPPSDRHAHSEHPLVVAWAQGALRKEVEAVSTCAGGGRNNRLNNAALALGEFVGGGFLAEGQVRANLEGACRTNGLWKDDGPPQCRATISSGLKAGKQKPRAIPASILAKIEAAASELPAHDPATGKVFDEPDTTGFVFYGDAEAAPPLQLIKKTLPRDGVALLGGQSGAGKTFIACNLAVSLASGADFFGRRIKERVGVAILAAEGAATLPTRLKVAGESVVASDMLPIAHKAVSINLMRPVDERNTIQQLRAVDAEMMDRFGVRLGAVILDTVAASFGFEDENSNAEVTQATNALRRIATALDALMIGVHHYGKDPSTGFRGGSAWRGNVDAALVVIAERNHNSGNVGDRTLILEKNRVGPEGPIAPFSLKFIKTGVDEDGEDEGDCIVVPDLATRVVMVSMGEMKRRTGRGAVAFRKAFIEALAAHGETRPAQGDGPKVRMVDLIHVRSEFPRFYTTGEDGQDAKDAAVRAAWKRELSSLARSDFATGTWDGAEWVWLHNPEMPNQPN